MTSMDSSFASFWHLITRLGEAQILLPAALLTVLLLLRRPSARPLALRWAVLIAVAALLTIISKVAFIGWGLGWPMLNFTGISGHAMFAAAVYPPLFGALAAGAAARTTRISVVAGCALALFVGISRVMVGAHSTSEVVVGLFVGGLVSAGALPLLMRLPPIRLSRMMPGTVALWLALMSVHAPTSRTHTAVTRLSLILSGHVTPYTRNDMLRHQRYGAA